VVVDLTPFFLRRNGIVDVVDARGIINGVDCALTTIGKAVHKMCTTL
jgi:hypothetical protein